MPKTQFIMVVFAAVFINSYPSGAIAQPKSDAAILKLSNDMTTGDLLKESRKYIEGVAGSVRRRTATGCSRLRLGIFFLEEALNKATPAELAYLRELKLFDALKTELRNSKNYLFFYCPNSELLSRAPHPAIGVVQLGDTLFKISQRYGMSMQEILRLNPGLDTTRLVAGTEIQLVKAVRPIAHEPLRFDQSLDELVRQGVVSPEERQRVRSAATAREQACASGKLSEQECTSGVRVRWRGKTDPQVPVSSGASDGMVSPMPTSKPLSAREQAFLRRIRSGGQLPQWRTYGKCNYDWAGWKLHTNGTRTTEADCGGTGMRWTVGVSCDRLLVARRTTDSGWSNWERPAGPDNMSRQGEDEMVAALCANAVTGP